jgi:hypothetical protein
VDEEIDLGLLLVALRGTIDKLELDFAAFAVQFAQSGQWEREGYNSAGDWLRFNCHLTSGAAWNLLSVGEKAGELPESVQAMREGDIGFAHLATMANTADKVKAFDESSLLPLAREHSPGKFHYKCLHYRHAIDARAYCAEQSDQAENHYLRLSTAHSGHLLLTGVLDPVSGAAVRSALEPLARRSGKYDDRRLEQRLADALVERCTAGGPAHLQVTASVETLLGLPGAAGGEMEFAMPVASATVQRLACDATLSRVLLDQRSLVIDVGQASRKILLGLRKALNLRDRHCRWPGCERPAFFCDAHHVQHWLDGGATELGNLVLLCKRHHRLHHEGGWQLVLVEGELMPVAPTTTFGLPRGPD